MRSNNDVVAIMVEPIQGEGGIQVPDNSYLENLRAICDEHDLLLILDEVQTGNGRTGRYFAYQHTSIMPDVVTTAKGLGNGFPIGACLARGKAAEIFGPGNHGTTYGGNPLACAAALAVINTIEQDKLCQHAASLGQYILDSFHIQLADKPYIKEIRGKGLMIGIELKDAGTELAVLAKVKGVLLNITGGGRVVRLLPPLIMNQSEADLLVNTVSSLIRIYAGEDSTD